MPSFTTRIELQSASKNDYLLLEEEMKKAAFKDIKRSSLPAEETVASPLEFNFNGNFTLLEVTDATAKAARKTGRHYTFTIIKEKKLSLH